MPRQNKRHANRTSLRMLSFAAMSLAAVWAASDLFRGQAALVYSYTAGERLVYKIDFKNAASADLRPMFAEASQAAGQPHTSSGLVQSFATQIRGELVATVLERDAQGVTVSYSLRNSTVDLLVGGQRAPDQQEALRRATARVVFAALDLRGRILSVRMDPGVGEAEQGFTRGLLGIIQVVLPDGKNENVTAWEAEEEDAAGRYLARYEVAAGASQPADLDCLSLRKSKLKYLGARPEAAATPGRGRVLRRDSTPVTPEVKPETDLRACFDLKSGRLALLEGSDKQVMAMANRVIGHSETSISLKLAAAETLSGPALYAQKEANSASARSVRASSLATVSSPEELKAMARRHTLGDATIGSLLAELSARQASGQREDTALYLKFRALAYLQPETCEPLGRLLAGAETGSLIFHILTAALGDAGNAEGQAALVSALRARRDDPEALLLLIPPLGLSDRPVRQAEEVLREFAFRSSDLSVASTAQLALGNMAYALSGTAPERANGIVEAFVEKMGAAASEGQIEQLLLVLGNAGNTQALSTIVRFVSHPSPDVRAAAVSALRFIEAEQADELLLKALAADPGPAARKAAAYALGFREMTPTTFEHQKRALLKDEDEEVRISLLRNLWNAREAFPEARELLGRAAREDPSKAVRDAALKMLAPDR